MAGLENLCDSNTCQLICRVQIFFLNLSVSQLPRALMKSRNSIRPCRYNGGLLKLCFCHSIVHVYIVSVNSIIRARAQERGRKIQMLNLELAEVKDTLQVRILETVNGSFRSFHYCRHFRDVSFYERDSSILGLLKLLPVRVNSQ